MRAEQRRSGLQEGVEDPERSEDRLDPAPGEQALSVPATGCPGVDLVLGRFCGRVCGVAHLDQWAGAAFLARSTRRPMTIDAS